LGFIQINAVRAYFKLFQRIGNTAQALEFTIQALELRSMGQAWRGEFERRKERLEKKPTSPSQCW